MTIVFGPFRNFLLSPPHQARWVIAGATVAIILLAATLFAFSRFSLEGGRVSGTFAPGEDAEDAMAMVGPDFTVRAVSLHFTGMGYSLNRAQSRTYSIPRIFLPRLPEGLEQMRDVKHRKSLFIRTVLPLILMENEGLALIRQRVEQLQGLLAAGASLAASEKAWLTVQFDRFGAKEGAFSDLLHRIGTVPVSLALAQAAMETGWGTSRFAREGRALYGQWTWSREVKGLVPKNRPPGESYRVRAFESLPESVSAYMMILNSHRQYSRFRMIRATLRARKAWPNGITAAHGVSRYSVLRKRYIQRLQTVIRQNRLHLLDGARLASLPTETPALESMRLAALDTFHFFGR